MVSILEIFIIAAVIVLAIIVGVLIYIVKSDQHKKSLK
jgi:nitrogen fixation-related uncharacterized protein